MRGFADLVVCLRRSTLCCGAASALPAIGGRGRPLFAAWIWPSLDDMNGFMPHGYCYFWNPLILWLHVISDSLITISYFCIPFALLYLARRRRDLPFNRMFWMFGLFILGCGTTHLMEIWTVWHPSYLLAGLIKAITAMASVVTALMLIPLVPKAVALPSSDDLRAINTQLQMQIGKREKAQEELKEILAARDRTFESLASHTTAMEELQIAQTALRQSQDQLTCIIQSAMDAIITVDQQQRIVIFNTAAEKMFGCPAAEAIGRSVEMFIPVRFRKAHTTHIHHFGDTRMTSRPVGLGRIWGMRTNGEEFPLDSSFSQVETGGRKFFTVILRDTTEREQSDTRNLRLASIVNSSGEAILSKDLSGTILSWNRGAEQLCGYTEAEVLGKNVCMIVPENRQEEEAYFIKEIERGRQVTRYETTRRHKNGSEIPVSLIVSPVRDASGQVIGASSIAHDVSDRRDAEEALRQQKYALDQHAIVATTDIKGTITYVNEKFCAISKYSRNELLGQNHRILNSGHHPRDFFVQMYHTIASGQVWHGEICNRAKDGSLYWVDTTIVPINRDGKPRQYLAIRAEITERKKAEQRLADQALELSLQARELLKSQQALQSQQLMLRLVLDSMAEGLVAVDEKGKFIIWNPAAEKIVGMGPANLTTEEWTEHYGLYMVDTITPFPPDRNPLLLAIHGEVALAKMFLRNRQLDKGVWIEASASPLRDEQGAIRGGVVAFRDITESREYERQIQTMNEELEGRVAARTRELEAANGELESFTYSVSHDLRAPLRHIAGFSGMLLEEFGPSLDPQALVYLQRIQQGTRRMGLLVDELLNLARLGRQSMKLQVVGLNQIVDEVISMLQPEYQGRDVEWRIAPLPSLQCDQILMGQVFQNLLSNALKYSRPRAHAVIEVGATEEPGKSIVIFVRDNGVGFPMKYADKLFGVFQRLHRAEEFEGTGVGLASVHRIIQRHGGEIWAHAELDRGAAFFFTLGEHEQAGPADRAAAAGAQA